MPGKLFQRLLAPLSALYLAIHRRTYARRLAAQRSFPGQYIISIGNLSAGGTGKTPVALDLAAELLRRDISVMAVLRGYGAKIPGNSISSSGAAVSAEGAPTAGQSPALLVAEGRLSGHGAKQSGQAAPAEPVPVTAREAGDEAMLYARLPGLRVAVGRDRAHVIERFGPADQARVILLDDAFQNPSVARDHELVLLDASVPLDKMAVIPAGRFREPPAALARAHTVLLTRVDHAPAERIAGLLEIVRQHAPNAAIFYSRHCPQALDLPAPKAGAQPHSLGAFCGLGNPDAFWRTLEEPPQSLRLAIKRAFPDHHAFRARDLAALERDAQALGLPGPLWITSAKDAVRLDALPDLDPELRARIFVQEIALEILERPGDATGSADAHQAFYERVFSGVASSGTR